MKIAYSFEEIPQIAHPVVLTIGNFDGVHRGHQTILKALRNKSGPTGSSVVLTFQNHPQHFFADQGKIPLISTLEERLDLLEACEVDLVIVLPFEEQLANLTYDAFLEKLRNHLPFEHLILGKGATLGKNRGGTEETVTAYARKHGFSVEFLDKLIIDGHIVSSGYIRSLLLDGKKNEAIALLGHELR